MAFFVFGEGEVVRIRKALRNTPYAIAMNVYIRNFEQTLVLASPASGQDGWLLAVPVHGWVGNGRVWRRAKAR